MKLKRKIRRAFKNVRKGRLILALIILFIFGYGCVSLYQDIRGLFVSTKLPDKVAKIAFAEETQENKELEVTVEKKEEVKVAEPVKAEVKPSKQYRLTSFYSNDELGTGSCTGSGKCEKDFQVNDKGWYTYKGKLVLAGATNECLRAKGGACGNWNTAKEGRKYFNYYDELQVVIDGVTYDAIILDSCGASMFVDEDRLDLFVSGKSSAIDRGYKGNNMITVFAEF